MDANIMSPATANTSPSAPSAASSSARTPPCCNVYNGHPKMLESLLYNFHQHINSFAAVAALSAAQQQQQSPVPASSANVGGIGSPPAAMSPVAIASAAAAAAMASQSQSPRAAASPASSHDSHRHNPIHRPRSGSVVSLGSTGSSFRDSYSPSHESSTSHDSFSRGSPASVGSSPSPSPPAHEGSKLFGILKGTVTSPYSSYFNGHHVAPRTRTPTNRTHTPTQPAHSPMVATSPVAVKRAYVPQDDDEQPMDLSCKRLRSDTPNSSPSTPLSPPDLESPPATGGSILQSILCGGGSSFFGNNSSSLSNKSSTRSPSRSTCSPAPRPAQRQGRRESTSSVSSSSSSTSLSRCSATRSRVALAKKMMQPVLARVSDWMLKVVQFAKSQPEFVSLPSQKDKLALLSQAWARILLLFMAETNFEFVVTPINSEEDDGKWDSECPTMQSVQKIQAFITKCQNLKMDAQEYHLMRMTMLFYSAPPGMANADFVDKVSTYVRQSLQDHLARSRPTPGESMRRYSTLLLSIHMLYGINCKMVENLFCQHILKDVVDMDALLRDMLDTYEDDDDEEAAERDEAEMKRSSTPQKLNSTSSSSLSQ